MQDSDFIRNSRKAKAFLKPIFELFVKITSSGLENIPDEGPYLLISNHRSDLDPLCITDTCPRHICWIADDYLFRIPLVGKFLEDIGAIPISDKKSDIISAFRLSRSFFQKKQIVGIFPEGHATITNQLQHLDLGEFHSGFAEFALRLKVDIIPAVIIAKKEKFGPMPIPKTFRKLMHLPEDVVNVDQRLIYEKVHVHYGKPVSIQEYLKIAENPDDYEKALHKLTGDMHEILLGMIREKKEEMNLLKK